LKIIVGLQSIEQLYASYEEANARNIISGFSSIFAFKSNDPKTRTYISDLFGKNIILEQYLGLDKMIYEEKRPGNVVEDWDLSELYIGEAVVGLPFTQPFRFKFNEYKE
jgi:hypothetical protein